MNMRSCFTSLPATLWGRDKKEKEKYKTTDCVYVPFLTPFLCYQELKSAEPILACGGRDIIRIKLSLGSRPVTLCWGRWMIFIKVGKAKAYPTGPQPSTEDHGVRRAN